MGGTGGLGDWGTGGLGDWGTGGRIDLRSQIIQLIVEREVVYQPSLNKMRFLKV